MKNKRLAFLSLFIIGGLSTAQAQNLEESVIFSQYETGATARFRALGNAQTALGGDLSNINGNPAGLGFFNTSDFSVSLDYFGDRNRATYFGNQTTANQDRIGLNQLGIVFNLPNMRARGSDLESGWLNFNVGIGYHKTNSFNSRINYSGVNPNNSIGDFMVDQNAYVGSFLGDIGWDMGLVDQVGANNPFYAMTSLDNTQGAMDNFSGTQSETNVSFGANYNNKFYIGGSVGFSSILHRSNTFFYEDGFIAGADNLDYPANGELSRFITDQGYNELLNSYFEYDQEFWKTTRGAGVNLKLGMIFRPTDMIRIGLNASSPTWYRMSDSYDDYFGITNFDPNSGQEISSFVDEEFDTYGEYNLRTPYRLSGGIAAVFSRGLISADVEYVDYASMRVTSSDNFMTAQYDQAISDSFQGAFNFKVGGELMVVPQFLLRAGYNHSGNPYQAADFKMQSFSGGMGYRMGNYYVDLTYQHWQQEYGLSPYTFTEDFMIDAGGISPVANITNTRNNVFLTIGAKF